MKTYEVMHKTIFWKLKTLKKLCVKCYGIGFYFCTPRIKQQLIEDMNIFINE